jgi:lysophospholipase L1-like esterase
MATCLKDGETILFIGDSITDCGRRDERFRPIGSGYVSFVRDFLVVREPEKKINVINTGIGGNTIEDLRNRWIDDAISHKPDWLSIKIGINDCHRWMMDKKENVLQSPEKFEEIFIEVLDATSNLLPDARLLLIDPFYTSLDIDSGLDSFRGKINKVLPEYIDVIDRMAKAYNARQVKTDDIFREHFKNNHPGVYFANEPVHPNQTGHMLIAESVYSVLEEK